MKISCLSLCGLALALELSPAIAGPVCQNAASPCQNTLTQEEVLAAARRYAARYMANLPSFACTQTTNQYEAGKRAKHWRKGDCLTSQLIWDQGREQRTLQLVNNRPVSNQAFWRSPLVSEGEFGNLLDSVLGNSSGATFVWRGSETVAERPVGIFEYSVDRRHSSMRLSVGSAEAVLPFHGAIYADETNGTVWRITNNADELPPELRTRSVSRSVDYGPISIGDNQFVLPVSATVLLDTGNGTIRNELRFDNYRKFTADSHISFTSEADMKADPAKH